MSPYVVPVLPDNPEDWTAGMDGFVDLLWNAAMAIYLDERGLDDREISDAFTAGAVLVSFAMVMEGVLTDPDEALALFVGEPQPVFQLALNEDLDLVVEFTWEDGTKRGVVTQRKERDDG